MAHSSNGCTYHKQKSQRRHRWDFDRAVLACIDDRLGPCCCLSHFWDKNGEEQLTDGISDNVKKEASGAGTEAG
jgi:hypothetical protein